ncbi:DHA2 family efflux MFS transporter permease subunit [Weissella cibaria]|uniref:DHA2 family efflux MFS transporter permease subunit n=1 Tax=Weissella cibaria TaxID=137591 RepID=UPI001C1F5194|nr:DHA2 family efflux MFS transporter permease subunit [Weissella cibaria]MBU7561846.1 DHA2 family efflux MFS transporter permease subunit [Weissella cibaria]
MTEEKSYKKWLALAAMSLGVFMALLDVTVVNVALPTMAVDFKTTFNNLQWVLNAYTIVFAVMLLIVSKLGDMFGRKKMFIASMFVFVIASAVNGMATSLTVLDIGRGVQAIGGSGLMSLAMALVASNFEGRERGTALGILGSVIGLSTASGPLVGGYLVEAFGWPSIFYINVPVGIIAVIMTWINVKETPSYGKGQKIDFVGMILSAAALFSAVYGLIQKESHVHWAWTDARIAGWLIAGIVLAVIFVLVELRVKTPMMNLKMFKSVNFVGAVIVAFTLGAGVYAINAYLTGLMQNYMGYTAFQTGLRQLVISIWSLILGPVTGILGNKFSKKWMISGALLLGGIGFLLLANAMTTKLTFIQLVPAMVLMGLTNAIVNPMLNTAGLEGVAPYEMGMAAGLLNVFRQFGVSFGVVMLGLTQTNHYEDYLNAHLGTVKMPEAAATGLHKALVEAGPFSGHAVAFSDRLTKAPFAHDFQQVVLHAYDKGMIAVGVTAAITVFVGAIGAALFMRDRKNA